MVLSARFLTRKVDSPLGNPPFARHSSMLVCYAKRDFSRSLSFGLLDITPNVVLKR
jgi:hypothetical protein